MQLAEHFLVRRAGRRRIAHGGPEAVEEAPHAADPRVAEVAPLLEGAEEHQVGAEGVGTPLLEVLVGVHHIPLRLRHLGALADDQSVRAEPRERLLEVEQAHVVQHHRDETRVEQMQHRVLIPADIGGDGEPPLRRRRVERNIRARHARIAQEVPRAVEERVADVGLAPRGRTARGAGRPVPRLVPRER